MSITLVGEAGNLSYVQHRAPLKTLVDSGLKRWLPPRLYWRFRAARQGRFEVELDLVRHLCDRSTTAVDIGASIGSYTVHMLIHARRCFAFEPRQPAAEFIATSLTRRHDPRLHIERVALSDHPGEAQLRIAVNEPGRSTLEAVNAIEGAGVVEAVTVPVRRLDDYREALGRVGFIKIDVEGHEEAVLRGATELMRAQRPPLLIELEERHNPGCITRTTAFLAQFGYRAHFFRHGRLHAIDYFDPARDQDPTRITGLRDGEPAYINNFLFIAGALPERLRRPG